MEIAESGTGPLAPIQTCGEGSHSILDDSCVCLNEHVSGWSRQESLRGLLSGESLNEPGVSAIPRCPVSVKSAGGAGAAATSIDHSGTRGGEVFLLSEEPVSTVQTSSPMQKASRIQLYPKRRVVHPHQEQDCAPLGRYPRSTTSGEPTTNKPAKAGIKASPRPSIKKSKPNVQPRPTASLNMSRVAQLKTCTKENAKIKCLKERGHSEPLKRSSVTSSKGVKEPPGQRLFAGDVRGGSISPTPTPVASHKLTLPVARLLLDSSSKDCCSTRVMLKPVPAVLDRTKKRAGPRTQLAPGKTQPVPPPQEGTSARTPNQDIQHLKDLLAAGGRRFEAIIVVMQHVLVERDAALKRCTELSQELVALREQLVSSATSCNKMEQEKDELRMSFEGVLQKAQERHHNALTELEEQLGAFYSAEWEKVHQAYQHEADRCRSRMQHQVNELRSKHETLEKELRTSHSEQMESLKRHYETSFEELKKSQEQERETHKRSLKEMETTLSEQIQDLARENATLYEKLSAEEENQSLLAEKSQDSHTLYLQQELESLKVVLELKNSELHQQNKKLMELKTLRETNLNLQGCLRKTQHENEDLRARLEEHTALHRQLSTEQVALQQTIMKETKMNNRLSLQNEELLWKLHNGDLWPPRNLPPSPSFQSAHNSGRFSSTPLPSS